jgi:acetyltransferase-like isoleucine patch superfamily enzyme
MKVKNKTVKRFELQDSASSYSRSSFDVLRTALYALRYKRSLALGANSVIRGGCQFNLTEGAKVIIGESCTVKENTYFILTKPNPIVEIGDYSGVGRNCYFSIKGHLVIGSYVRIGPDVCILDQSHQYEANDLIMNQPAVIKNVVIQDDVWIGRGATILPGVRIGEGAIVGANSLVNKNIPANEIWGGVPARFLKMRT